MSENIKIKWQTSKRIKGNRKNKIIEKYIKENTKNLLLDELRKVYEIDEKHIIRGAKKISKIKINSKSLSISTKAFAKFKIEENNKTISLMKYINNKGLYSITFDNPKYMYFMNNCFEDRSGISEIESILEMFEPQSGIETVISEKGSFINTQTTFNSNSMFGFVESICVNEDYIFCDDLGDEWADHITLNLKDSSISFIHSKHGEESTSASNLHDVVGQGIKNLGNMFFSKDQIDQKVKTSLCKQYKSGNGVQTQIERIRKTTPNLSSDIDSLLRNHRLYRKCILSCSFISKSKIEAEFNDIKQEKKVRGHIIQLLWILSSFAHAAKEANVIPIIYCAA
ncbi:hypothetical protein [Acinetobacter equi]|uniref:hypothetical protein n=1 Tax=Acinetobacter equi TaxID=1324350 RepID=UPI001D0D5396|nr:hypothetical protein [Acinetobacter equi]